MPLPAPHPSNVVSPIRGRLFIALFLTATATSSASAPIGATISFIKGECRSLVLAGRVATRSCRPELIGISYPTQEISFVFGLSDGRLISFKGRPDHALPRQTTVKVGQVTIVGRLAHAAVAPVMGSCVFTGMSGGRDHLACDASGGGNRYAGSFLTKGETPARFRF